MGDTADKNPPIAWIILTLSTTFIGFVWFYMWFKSPWPIVGYVVGPFVVIIPAIAGIAAWVRRVKNKRKVQ
jgi:multidrug resistance efflux pump